jgi:putative acetyltransferase
LKDLRVRLVTPADDGALARIIREGMDEFGICVSDEVPDPELRSISAAYGAPRSAYFAAEFEGRVLGGGGIGPIEGQPEEVCELRKMYLVRDARGLGAGRCIMEACLDAARDSGYTRCFLATLESMERARRLYAGFGFRRSAHPLPGSGHLGCDTWYSLDL